MQLVFFWQYEFYNFFDSYAKTLLLFQLLIWSFYNILLKPGIKRLIKTIIWFVLIYFMINLIWQRIWDEHVKISFIRHPLKNWKRVLSLRHFLSWKSIIFIFDALPCFLCFWVFKKLRIWKKLYFKGFLAHMK